MDNVNVRLSLPDGSEILAHGRLDLVPTHRPLTPTFAVYLDPRWANDPTVLWPFDLVSWPDFGVPADENAFFATMRDLHRRAASGELVEVACYGGIGRTGTVLACLAVLSGLEPSASVTWVRTVYHAQAVETSERAALVTRFAVSLEQDSPPGP